ncbi:hypothetical protein [Streptomyces griseiscabiei]|uniref:Uncharacterized protein n=1 Tax=Streptomyces griseiscabiei TaxID=2993540 RepID=A0ABU4L6I2_9ACTN|nr:hypothetical protein [Streptomyces griseiscabiei]MBZ3906312.1 hypothetical protein [Streptomyces griseiscabiei]MDX2911309.1 hypothetical protein [Streptomyces griseiscabiei]
MITSPPAPRTSSTATHATTDLSETAGHPVARPARARPAMLTAVKAE